MIDAAETSTEWSKDTLRAEAIVESAKRQYRCRIRLTNWSTEAPGVAFASRVPTSNSETLNDWSAKATGRLSGPQTLQHWFHYFRAFEAALDALTEEIDGPVSDGQRRAFEGEHDEPHPIFEVNHVPDRLTTVAERRRY